LNGLPAAKSLSENILITELYRMALNAAM